MPSHLLAALLHALAKDQRVRPRKIHLLEDALRLRQRRRVKMRVHALGPNHHQFARFHVALVFGAQQIEGAGLGGEDNGIRQPVLARNAPHRQRTEAARIAGGENMVAGRNHE